MIELGVGSPSLKDQIGLNTPTISCFQDDNNAITRLYVRGYISGSDRDWCRKKLLRKINNYLKEVKSTNRTHNNHELLEVASC
jgi:hypothetical protein